MKKVLIIAAILTAAGLLLFIVTFIIAGFNIFKLGTAKYETNTYTVPDSFDNIDIRTKETDVLFKRSEDGQCRVVCDEREKARHQVSVKNGTLTIHMADQRSWYDYLTFFSPTLSMTVYLPSEYYEALKIESQTGNVSLSEQFSFGGADITSGTGNVSCGASVNGSLNIHTSTGGIRLDGVRADTIALSVSTGQIEADKVTCTNTFSVSVSTGRTTLTDLTCQDLHSKGSTGNVSLKNVLADNTFDIERSTGNISLDRCDAGQLNIRTSTGRISGTLRSEKVFTATTSTGSVHVPDTQSGGKCTLSTSTGSIDISIAP